ERLNKTAGTRVHLMDTVGRRPPTAVDVHIMPGGIKTLSITETGCFLQALADDKLSFPPSHDRPAVYFCGHGKRDACCAKFGLQTIRRMQEIASRDGAEVQTWTTTHLGGDRFAGTALVFPWGHMYGWLCPEDAEALLKAALTGRPYGKRFRGCAYLDRLRQTAHAFLYGEVLLPEDLRTVDAIEVVEIGDQEGIVRARLGAAKGSQAGVVELHLRKSTYSIYSTCRMAATGAHISSGRWEVSEWRFL
ncbi:MAG: sucrase ferredoxin, partial [Gammaproteobacteria bacterium]